MVTAYLGDGPNRGGDTDRQAAGISLRIEDQFTDLNSLLRPKLAQALVGDRQHQVSWVDGKEPIIVKGRKINKVVLVELLGAACSRSNGDQDVSRVEIAVPVAADACRMKIRESLALADRAKDVGKSLTFRREAVRICDSKVARDFVQGSFRLAFLTRNLLQNLMRNYTSAVRLRPPVLLPINERGFYDRTAGVAQRLPVQKRC